MTSGIRTVRTGSNVEQLQEAIRENLFFVQGQTPETATITDWYMAVAYSVRDRLLTHWLETRRAYYKPENKVVAYLSAEFLLGPHLGNNLLNLNLGQQVRAAVEGLGLNFYEVMAAEEEPGLGNGGLGRLAACYMDSLSTLAVPAIGYGIRYEFGIFDQEINNGWQVEAADEWLRAGNPWEIRRPHQKQIVMFGGRTADYTDNDGNYRVLWAPDRLVCGIPYDTPILGYRSGVANTLRLWKAEAYEDFNLEAFNIGDYYGAVEQKVTTENITKVLYPNDQAMRGKALRLEQQYFFASCSLQDMLRMHTAQGLPLETFADKWAVQLNDTHPAIAVAELMRLLVDSFMVPWDTAWEITQATFGYTNHTLLPEALEKWPLALFRSVLPRHLEIIYEINQRFLTEVRRRVPGDEARVARLSLIDESGERYVRMAHLATVGSHSINGVAALHSELLKHGVLRDFAELYPERFSNVTNGVTPRRWIALANPALTALISEKIGNGWLARLEHDLELLEQFADDEEFLQRWRRVKLASKECLSGIIRRRCGVAADPESMFDIQVKRIHEYKRQHLNVLHIIYSYLRLKRGLDSDAPPRTFIFGGKAAPGYFLAKLIIKLIHSVGEVINKDASLEGRLRVAFVPDYNVTNSLPVYPAADLSEQISTAGKEASGTGNMKFAMNGALTIGTLDGANVEIRECVGEENFFLFGLTAEEVMRRKAEGYQPWAIYQQNEELREVIDQLRDGAFSRGDKELFRPIVDQLLGADPYMLLADFESYVRCQAAVSREFLDTAGWTRKSILNTARSGKFSSDRSIREYCREIWNVKPLAKAAAEVAL